MADESGAQGMEQSWGKVPRAQVFLCLSLPSCKEGCELWA